MRIKKYMQLRRKPNGENQTMKVILISHTPNPEKTVACAAKLCYANSDIGDLYEGLTEDKVASFVDMLAKIGHESPIEHISFTFGVEGISRTCSHQLVRHRIASYSQQSQRYVSMDNFSYIIPPEISKDDDSKKLFIESMNSSLENYNKLTKTLTDKYFNINILAGADEKIAKLNASKKAIEDARFVLPNACETKIIVTMNARTLLNFFHHRCCNRAQWEIKAVADEMLKLVCEIAPNLFRSAGPSCFKKPCPEGNMTCGQTENIREFYNEIHQK